MRPRGLLQSGTLRLLCGLIGSVIGSESDAALRHGDFRSTLACALHHRVAARLRRRGDVPCSGVRAEAAVLG